VGAPCIFPFQQGGDRRGNWLRLPDAVQIPAGARLIESVIAGRKRVTPVSTVHRCRESNDPKSIAAESDCLARLDFELVIVQREFERLLRVFGIKERRRSIGWSRHWLVRCIVGLSANSKRAELRAGSATELHAIATTELRAPATAELYAAGAAELGTRTTTELHAVAAANSHALAATNNHAIAAADANLRRRIVTSYRDREHD